MTKFIGPKELGRGEEIQLLESVGMAINILTGMTHPLDVNSAPIFNEGEATHITDWEDIDNLERLEGLSREDLALVIRVLESGGNE